jgi:ABC-2 type transport system permease protein
MFLPYVSSAFVPTKTMPGVLQVIAAHQPVTPITETLRGLMMGTPIGSNGAVAIVWCVGGITLGSLAATLLFRQPYGPVSGPGRRAGWTRYVSRLT